MIFSRKNISERDNTSLITDAELIRHYRLSAEKELIGILFKRYSHQVMGICLKYLKNREDSRDAVMQIFEKLFDDLQKHEIDHFKSWLLTVAKNHCLMQLRKSKHEIPVEDISIYRQEEAFMENGDDVHLNHVDNEKLRKFINHLNHEQKTCIELFYLAGKSYQEIAEMTGYELKKVKSYIQNGKRNLKIMLTENNE